LLIIYRYLYVYGYCAATKKDIIIRIKDN